MSDFEIDIRLKRYPAKGATASRVAVQDFRLTGRRGELICLFGPSGCGKTTVLNIVAGLDRDYEGVVRLPRSAERAAAGIGYVFQTPRLLPWRTVAENLRLVLADAAAKASRVDELIEVTGLGAHRHAYPAQLSVGLQRRVALARAFAVRPDILLMDEPFVSLDAAAADRLRGLLLEIWSARPTTVLFVTHDLREAIRLADRIALLSPGPARVLAERGIDIPRDGRTSSAVEACRECLAAEYEALLAQTSDPSPAEAGEGFL